MEAAKRNKNPQNKSNYNEDEKPNTSKKTEHHTKKSSSEKKGSKRSLPKKAVHILQKWLYENRFHAYPTEDQKEILSQKTSLTVLQMNNWLINARRRYLPEIMRKEGLDFTKYIIRRPKNSKKARRSKSRKGIVHPPSASRSSQVEVHDAPATVDVSEEPEEPPEGGAKARRSKSRKRIVHPPRASRSSQVVMQEAPAIVDVSDGSEEPPAFSLMVPDNLMEEGMLVGRIETVSHTEEIDVVTVDDDEPYGNLLRASLSTTPRGSVTIPKHEEIDNVETSEPGQPKKRSLLDLQRVLGQHEEDTDNENEEPAGEVIIERTLDDVIDEILVSPVDIIFGVEPSLLDFF